MFIPFPGLAFQFRKSDQEKGAHIYDLIAGKVLPQVPVERIYQPINPESSVNFEGVPLFVHRAVIQKIFLSHLSPSIRCHLSSRLVSYDEIPESAGGPGSLRLVFENGNTATCDLLIGVDGIKSIVRKKFVADHHDSTESGQVPNADPMWSGTFAYRCMIESKLIAEQMPNHRVLTTPVIVSHYISTTIHEFISFSIVVKTRLARLSMIQHGATKFLISITAHSRVPISTRSINQRAGVFI
jgi:salicylate hydroxylase